MSARIGVGVIGLGPRGRLHAQAYREADVGAAGPRPRLVAASDEHRESCLDAVLALGFRRSTPEYQEVLDDPEVDVVSICLPAVLVPDVARAAVEAGKPFWIGGTLRAEGPGPEPLPQWHEIARAAEQAGLVTAVAAAPDTAPTREEAARFLRSVATGEQFSPSLADVLDPAGSTVSATS